MGEYLTEGEWYEREGLGEASGEREVLLVHTGSEKPLMLRVHIERCVHHVTIMWR